LEADVCIVGAGPAGITLALELLGAGLRVSLLESGGLEPSKPPRGQSVGHPYFRLDRTAVRAFGGTSHIWEDDGEYLWHSLPLDRLDFEARPGIEYSGWPYSRAVLAPYYDRASAATGGLRTDIDIGTQEDDDLSSHLAVRPGHIVMGYVHRSTTTFAQYANDLSRADAVQLVLNATVAEISVDQASRARGVRAFSASGRAITVRARVTVLAAGGIENARLLLLGSRERPQGLGNEHDLVGRFFMEHLTVPSGVVEPDGPALFGQPLLYALREHAGETFRPVLRAHDEIARREALLNVAFILTTRSRAAATEGVRSLSTLQQGIRLQPRPERLAGHARNAIRDVAHIARARVSEHEVFILGVQAEQEPNPESRIKLGEKRDELGLRLPALDWRLSDRDRSSIRRSQELLDEELRLAGIGSVRRLLGDEDPPAVVLGIHHHMGTTRMHADPHRGVVDADCRVHSVGDLYVAGSSVFPTGGWANPTLTIIALAIRLADHLAGVLRAQRQPAQ
jgi:choline dehydrogenase-like flavoprotein